MLLLIIAPTCFGLSSWLSLRLKHVEAIINKKSTRQQLGMKYYIQRICVFELQFLHI